MIELNYTVLWVLPAVLRDNRQQKFVQKKHEKSYFSCSTFFDALEAFIYKASRAYFFSREKIPFKIRLITCYLQHKSFRQKTHFTRG